MNKDKLTKMLNTVYTVELKGSALGYMLTVLASEQERLNEKSRNDITDIDSVMSAVANNMVGNDLLHAVYEAAGEEFLGFAMGIKPETIKKVMESPDLDSVKAEVQKAIKENRAKRDKNLH
jgi:Cu/Ag efflux pump CusA